MTGGLAVTGGLAALGGVAVRVPLLPLATIERLTGGAARAAWLAGGEGGDLGDAVRRDAAHLRGQVAALLADPLVRTAVAYASPNLDAALDRLGDGDPPPRGLVGYLLRMAGRPVPFGLFAGCASGTAAGAPAYDLAARSALRVRARLDVAAAESVVERLPRGGLTFVPNSTAYAAAGRLRIVERAGGRYHPVALEPDDALRAVLAAARDGATLAALAESLVGEEVGFADAYGYVTELVEAQVLVPDVPVAAVAAVAAPAEVAAFAAEPARDRLAAAVAAVRAVADVPADRAVHVDSSRPATVVLGDAVLAEAARAVDLLHTLYRETPADTDLAAFTAAFARRYGAAEVPLLEALDPDLGVGFGAPLAVSAAGAPLLSGFTPAPAPVGATWTPIDHHLVDILSRALLAGAREVDPGPAEFHSLRNQRPRAFPDAVALVATVAAASAEVAAGDFRLVVHDAVGPNGLGLVARFAELDPGLDALLREHVAREEALRPDAVFAEVVHVPERRAGNVAVRPPLRAYEIPLLTASGVPPERRIPPGDLRVSVADGRVVLRSERLGREVLPRVTAADEPWLSALPVYRFLAAVQADGVTGRLGWSWGQVGSAPYLPRIVTGRLVLARAQWRWFRIELAGLTAAATPAARYAALQRLREKWDLPRWVTVARGERELPVDLDGVAAAELVAAEARRAGQLSLREMLPAPDELCLTGPDGRYAHEVVIPFVRTAVAPRAVATPRPLAPAYVPGSEWLGARVYTGPGQADGVLRDLVAPLAAGAPLWWYDRVAGPAPYLLLRFYGDAPVLLPALRDRAAPLVASGRIAAVELDTYRSAGDERVAHADSVAALRVVLAGDDLDARWRAAYWGVDRLLADAGLDDAARLAAVRAWRARLVAEHGETGERALRWAARVHRARRADLAAPDPWLPPILDARSAAIGLAGAPEELLRTLCGQHVTRLLRAAHGEQQVVLYALLERRYLSRRRDAGRS